MAWDLGSEIGLESGVLTVPDFTGTVSTATASSPYDAPSATGILDSLTKSVGSVADYGYNVQKTVLANQARSQDLQLEALKQSLGFKTASLQANTAATVAGYQAQAQIAQAQKAATGGGSASLLMLALVGMGAFLLARK